MLDACGASVERAVARIVVTISFRSNAVNVVQLFCEKRGKQLFENSEVAGVSCFECGVVRVLVGCDQLWNRFRTRKPIAEPYAQDEVCNRSGGSPITVGKRMNPIQPPQNLSGKVDRRLCPVVLHIVAQLLHARRYEMSLDRLVFAAANVNASRPEHSGIGAQAFQCDAL